MLGSPKPRRLHEPITVSLEDLNPQDNFYMIFSDRDCNYPQPAFGKWWMTQFRRWGMVKGAPDYQGIAKRVMRPDLYLEAMKEMGVAKKVTEVQKFALWDGRPFDAADPEKYATSFPINSLAS